MGHDDSETETADTHAQETAERRPKGRRSAVTRSYGFAVTHVP